MMQQKLAPLIGFMKKEFSQTLRDPVMRVFLFVAPLVQLTLFGYGISTEFRNIRLAVNASPSDTAARELSEKFYVSGYFTPVKTQGLDPFKAVYSGRADAVLSFAPGGLSRSNGRGQADVQLLIDATNATKAKSVENYARSILASFFEEKGKDRSAQGLSFDVRLLYNPTLETSYFMVPGVMTMIICLITVMLTGMSLAREKEMGTFETIIAAPLTSLEIIAGKTLPFVVLGMLNALMVIAAGLLIFNIPIRGSLLFLLVSSFVFVCTTVSIGTLISTVSRNQQQAMMGSFLFIFPANLMAGIMFPVENMPLVMRTLAYLDPLYYFTSLLRNTMLKGVLSSVVWFDLGILAVMAVAVIYLAVKRFKGTLN